MSSTSVTIKVPPPPLNSKIADDNGFMNQIWVKWINQLFLRAGGSLALTNVQLADQQSANLIPIQAEITVLQNSLATFTTATNASIAALNTSVNDLGQGPNL